MEVPAIRYVFWKIMIFMIFLVGDFLVSQTSLFSILVGAEDLQNQAWPLRSRRFAAEWVRSTNKHIFLQKNNIRKTEEKTYKKEVQKST